MTADQYSAQLAKMKINARVEGARGVIVALAPDCIGMLVDVLWDDDAEKRPMRTDFTSLAVLPS